MCVNVWPDEGGRERRRSHVWECLTAQRLCKRFSETLRFPGTCLSQLPHPSFRLQIWVSALGSGLISHVHIRSLPAPSGPDSPWLDAAVGAAKSPLQFVLGDTCV